MSSPSPIILALDVATESEAMAWVERLQPQIGIFKVGMQLFYRAGRSIVRNIRSLGADVFLDLKLHDIPNTVASACEQLLALEPLFLTVHTTGGPAMLKAVQVAASGSRTRLLGVTALTSLDEHEIQAVYPGSKTINPSEWATHLAGIAQQAGINGIVCSALENRQMRSLYGDSLCLVNPGIRLNITDIQDQKRVVTPREAMLAGANYMVIGRPILSAADPVGMVKSIQAEIDVAIGLSA